MTGTSVRSYSIDPVHSNVGFSIQYLLVTKIFGAFPRVSGSILIAEDGETPVSFSAAIEASAVDTRHPDRDQHLRSAGFLDTESHPHIHFRSTEVAPLTDTLFTVVGDLELRGVKQQITLRTWATGSITDPMTQRTRLGFEATGVISRSDFGMTFNQPLPGGGLALGDDVFLFLQITALADPATNDEA